MPENRDLCELEIFFFSVDDKDRRVHQHDPCGR